jgi:integrase/recombinase XerD
MSLPIPIDKRALYAIGVSDVPKYLTKEEVGLILQACENNERDHLLINMLWQTGARISEILDLRREDIDFRNGLIRLKTLKRKKPANRIVEITPSLMGEISAYVLNNKIRDKLFDINRQRAHQILKKYTKIAGIDKDAHLHTLRHSHAINLLLHGVPLPIISERLGHASIARTMIYTKVVRQDARMFLDRVEW